MKSYLKFLSRNKLYTAIEAAGLVVSLAFVILIGSYVVQQYGMAHENPDWKRIYGLGTNDYIGLSFWDKEELEINIPEVETAARMCLDDGGDLEFDGQKVYGKAFSVLMTDPELFDLFPNIKWLSGTPEAFRPKDAALVSESFAQQLRKTPGEDLTGKILKINGSPKQIVGIVQDFDNLILTYTDIILNIESSWGADQDKEYNSIGNFSTYFRVRKDISREESDAKVMALIEKNYEPVWGDACKAWHTYRLDEAFFSGKANGMLKEGNLQMLRLLTIVVLLLLISAVFNYVNLSFALSGKRAKEMATRRLVGATRKNILSKHIGESILFTAVCFAAALLLAYLLVPMMNSLMNIQEEGSYASLIPTYVPLRFKMTPGYLVIYLLSIVVLGTLCGAMPAAAAARYEPIDIIKGTLRRRNRMVFSKVFIIAQNALAVFLIALAIVMEVQMKHMMDRPTHSQTANRFYIEYSASGMDQMKLFKDKVEALPFVTSVGVGRGLPGMINMTLGIRKDDGANISIPMILCDSTYFRLLGLEIEEDFGHPLTHSIWLDRSAFVEAEVSDTSASFAMRFSMNGATAEYIGGVVSDFPSRSASAADQRTLNSGVIISRPEEMRWAHSLLIGTIGEDKEYTESIMKAYEEYRIEQFGYIEPSWRSGFVADLYSGQLAPARKTMRLLELFMVLSVMIALLGLVAMSSYFSGESTKQIAIRKVFGGDVESETWRSIGSYMTMVGVACLVGVPLAVWAAGLYLQRFAYRISGYGWIFVVAVAISVAIAFASVLWQTLSAARTNPATELKKE